MHAVAALVAIVASVSQTATPTVQPEVASDRPFPLMVGDPAPALTVKEWVRGEPVVLGQGRVTLLEFWATWCGPCREGMPHLTELQKKYGDRVTIIGVNAWEPDQAEVRPFVEKNADRMGYTVAMDDVPEPPPEQAAEAKNHSRWATQNGRMSLGWMKASGWMESGIPCVFIVDQRGRLAWAGNPGAPITSVSMDEALERVVAGTWDMEQAAAEYRQAMSAEISARGLWKELSNARRAKDWPAAIAACDRGLALGARHAAFAGPKFRILLVNMKNASGALTFGREALAGAARDSWVALGDIAYVIVYPEEGVPAPGVDLVRLAMEAAERADELSGGTRAHVIDSLARAYFLAGDLARAIKEQERALALAHSESMREQFGERLDEYRKRSARR